MAVYDECELANVTNATTRIPIETGDYILTVKIIVGTTCLLSILGASLIILTYVAFRDLRTIARQLLVNLSVADILIAASHFVGLLTNYERFLYSNLRSDVDVWCSVQGAVTMYGTISSFLWTIAVALYMFTVIVMKRPEIAKKMVPVYYLVCWGVPIVFPVWFGVKRYLGFELPADVGMLSDHHCHAMPCIVDLVIGKETTGPTPFSLLIHCSTIFFVYQGTLVGIHICATSHMRMKGGSLRGF